MQNDYYFWMDKWNDRLRKARTDAEVSDTEIARACGVKPASVHGWMSGDTKNIESQNLLAACKLLKVSPFWVMFGEQTPDDINLVPDSAELPAMDTIRLLAMFSQASEAGRTFILGAAEKAEKSSF